MGLLDVEIRTIVDDSISELLLPVTITKVSRGTYDVSEGSFEGTTTTTDHIGQGFKDKLFRFEFSDVLRNIDGFNQDTETKIVVIQKSFDPEIKPEPGDRLVFDGEEYEVQSVIEDPASATWEMFVNERDASP